MEKFKTFTHCLFFVCFLAFIVNAIFFTNLTAAVIISGVMFLSALGVIAENVISRNRNKIN